MNPTQAVPVPSFRPALWPLVHDRIRFQLSRRAELGGEPGQVTIDGKLYAYSVHTPCPGSGVARHVRLYPGGEPIGSERVYDCAEYLAGHLECDCPDYLYRHSDSGTLCKHLRACEYLGLWHPVESEISSETVMFPESGETG